MAAGVRRDGVLVDPAHDFGKNTRHSLEVTRRLDELVATGWPVLVSLSNKDFVGETLDRAGRTSGWRARSRRRRSAPGSAPGCSARTRCAATRQVLDMVASIRGTRPAVAVGARRLALGLGLGLEDLLGVPRAARGRAATCGARARSSARRRRATARHSVVAAPHGGRTRASTSRSTWARSGS